MNYKLRFHELALKEWKKLDPPIQEQFKKKLAQRLENPRVPSSTLAGIPQCYKIKLRSLGYRLIYRVEDDILFVTIIAIGKRENLDVYRKSRKRITS